MTSATSFSSYSVAILKNKSFSRDSWYVEKGIALPPAGISTNIGVSTSKKPLLFIKFRTDEIALDLFTAISKDSSLEMRSKYLCLYLISLSFKPDHLSEVKK